MITGSLAAVAHQIDSITKKKSDIVLLLSERLPSATDTGRSSILRHLARRLRGSVLSAKCNQWVLQGLPLSNSTASSWLSLGTIRSMYSRLNILGLSLTLENTRERISKN
jgi:hypothetical protein